MDFDIRESNGTVEVFLKGRFSLQENDAFKQILDGIRGSRASRFVLDLGELEYMDSAGLGKLVLLRDAAEEAKVSISLRNPQGRVKKLLSLSRFHEEIAIE